MATSTTYDATSGGPAPSIAVVGLQIATGLLLTHPLGAVDTVFKVNYQPTKAAGSNAGKINRYNNTLDAARGVVEADGYLGLLRALVPSFAYTLLYSTGFETFYQIYQRVPFHATPLAQLAARDFAVATWRGVISPLRTLTTRLLVRPSARSAVPGPLAFDPLALWNASTDAEERQKPWLLFRPSIALLEIAAAVTGQIANSLVAVPVTEIFYAVATRGLTNLKKDEWQQIATLGGVASAGVAVRLANVAIETVSRRLQAQPSSSDSTTSKIGQAASHATEADAVVVLRPVAYKGAVDAFQRIVEEEGFTGLLHGWGVQLGGTVGIAAITIGLARAQGRI